MTYLKALDTDASLIDVLRAYDDLSPKLTALAERLMRGPSPFSAGERERIAWYVSVLNGCGYCTGSHGATAALFGLETAGLAEHPHDVESADLPAELKPIYAFVRKLTLQPGSVGREDVEAIYEAGWDDDAVCHASLVCGYFNLMNRWVEGIGIEADPEHIRRASEVLHQRGYRATLGKA